MKILILGEILTKLTEMLVMEQVKWRNKKIVKILVKHISFVQKLKILVKNRSFRRKSKFWIKNRKNGVKLF